MKSSACARWKAAVGATFGQKIVIFFYTAVAQYLISVAFLLAH